MNIFTLRMLRDQYHAEHLDTEAEALDAAIEALEKPQQVTGKLNSDCISRQAAIDAVRDRMGKGETNIGDTFIECFEMILNALPSAQPEIIRCECCKYWDTYPSSTAAPLYHKCNAGVVAHLYTKAEGFCSRAIRRHDE